MAGADSFVGVAPDGTGKKVDVSELTRRDGTVVERQRIVLADPNNPDLQASVTPEGVSIDGMAELLSLMKKQNALLLSIAMQLGSMAAGGFVGPDDLMKG